MNKSQQVKFQSLYRKHVSALKRQGKAESTMDVYARAVRRVAEYWDCCPDKLTVEQLEAHFDALIGSHSWSTVKVDRSGLQFFARMKVHIRCGKGSKDRLVTLPQMTLDALRRYWKTHRHATLLFPTGRTREERANASVPMDRGGVQQSLKVIAQSCGLKKRVTPHTLRHCYGALLVEAGVNLRVIQHEMGHERPNTTALYTQLTQSTFEESSKLINGMLAPLNVSWGA